MTFLENTEPQKELSINTNSRRRAMQILTAALLVLLPLIYFFPAVLGKVTLAASDGWSETLGIRMIIGEMIKNGQLPLWNPYVFAGMPLLAGSGSGVLYPPTWLFAILSPQAAMNLMVITTYHLALIGTFLYARRIGVGRLGAIVAGITFAFGGYMVAHLGHTSIIASAAWLPWILLAIEELYLKVRWRWVALGAIFVALQIFAGEPQMAFYSLLLAVAYLLFSIELRPAQERRLRFLLVTIAMLVCGALLSMIQILPRSEVLKFGDFAELDYENFSKYSFPPRQILSLIFPYFFGGASVGPDRVSYWGEWNLTEACGYVGMMAWLLALVALKCQKAGYWRHRLIVFWGLCALFALLLAFGSYLPFGIHYLLHGTPIYGLFPGSGRHLFEFTFAIAILAGLGVTGLTKVEWKIARRAVLFSSGILALIIVVGAIIYHFFADWFVTDKPLPPLAGSLTNPDLYIPIVFFILSVGALLIYRGRWPVISAGALVAFLFLDLMSFGFYSEWRTNNNLAEKLADAPPVKFIKERETDLNSFRILSHTGGHNDDGTRLLDYSDISIAKGLQSVNGRDSARLSGMANLAGGMTPDGRVSESKAFSQQNQEFNLLNVKYLLFEEGGRTEMVEKIESGGIKFGDPAIDLKLLPGESGQLEAKATGTELAFISSLGESNHLTNGSPVVRVRLRTNDGRLIEREIQAGRDTSEYAYDREDVRASIKHARAQVIESWDQPGFQGHNYLGRISFDRSEITTIELEYVPRDAGINITRATLYDAETGQSHFLRKSDIPNGRWLNLTNFGGVTVYENLKALPRAWFARRTALIPSHEVLETIRRGRFKDGTVFDPAETVLLEKEIFGNRRIGVANTSDAQPFPAEVKVTRYEPQRIELQTRNANSGFLVLSEIYYRGWEAWVDGQRTPVERVNYNLRGIILPAGDHRVEFVFRASSFRNGAVYSLLGILLLLSGVGARRLGAEHILARLEPKLQALGESRRLMRLKALMGSYFFPVSAAIILIVYGGVLVKHAVYAVNGSDSQGYIALARLFVEGNIIKPVPELKQLDLPDNLRPLFTPLGFYPGPRPATIVGFYPIGLPLHMAIGALIGGWKYGPFLVNPIAGVLSLILIYLVGLELGLPRGYSTAGAILLAAFPTFIFFMMQPASDGLATFWALMLVWVSLRSRARDAWGLLAGAAFGIAFLVRPSNILLLIPLIFCLRLKPKVLIFFCLGGLPLAGLFFAYNVVAFENPLRTGYTVTGHETLLTTDGLSARFNFYIYWLSMLISPLILLGCLGVAFCRKIDWRIRALILSWFISFLVLYTFYNIYKEWWYTRFMLPAIPAMILGFLLTARSLIDFLKQFISEENRAYFGKFVMVTMIIISLSFSHHYSQYYQIFGLGKVMSTHEESVQWADRLLPRESLILSMEMSGTLKFYADRLILRYDLIAPHQWQTLNAHLAQRGYRLYALLMSGEVEKAKNLTPGKWTQIGVHSNQFSLWMIEPKT
jgi:Bacterial membrane protein YfhO/Dolichyl-phosphate-mannose-protein mannosyltransferase